MAPAAVADVATATGRALHGIRRRAARVHRRRGGDPIGGAGQAPAAQWEFLPAGDPLPLAARFAGELLAGRQRPWVDLRRGPLAIRDSLRLFASPSTPPSAPQRHSCSCRVASSSIAPPIRPGGRRLRAADGRGLQPAISRLGHAAQRAGGGEQRAPQDRGPRAAGKPGTVGESAFQVLQDVLGSVPAKVRYRIEKLMFTETSFTLEGRTVRTATWTRWPTPFGSRGWRFLRHKCAAIRTGHGHSCCAGNKPGKGCQRMAWVVERRGGRASER